MRVRVRVRVRGITLSSEADLSWMCSSYVPSSLSSTSSSVSCCGGRLADCRRPVTTAPPWSSALPHLGEGEGEGEGEHEGAGAGEGEGGAVAVERVAAPVSRLDDDRVPLE